MKTMQKTQGISLLLAKHVLRIVLASVGVTGTSAYAGNAAVLEISVTGIASRKGEIGCALYAGPEGFPMQPAKATQHWQPANPAGVTCRFEGLARGSHAVAPSHDVNGNRRTDTDFIGLPTEA